MQQTSTAISDLILAFTSFGTAFSLLRLNTFASVGFFLMGAAASCGVYRFSRTTPSNQVLYWHQTMAWVATILGMSLVASGFHRHYNNSIMSAIHMGSALALMILSSATSILTSNTQALLVSSVSSAAVVSIGVFSALHTNPFGILGAVFYVVAGAVGTKGEFAGVLCVDWFHFVLAFANIVFFRAFSYDNAHVFYKEG
ncbi:uncharacterized protein [Asterias amurensis]|uniref:uncharacterized protein n=1 Tax=Asterias amurensis TaxID=7602 RepID=UPI003AB8A87A